jgi:hypothetical protein
MNLPSWRVVSRVMHYSELYGGQRKRVKIVRFGLAVRKSLCGNSLQKVHPLEIAIWQSIPKRMPSKTVLT